MDERKISRRFEHLESDVAYLRTFAGSLETAFGAPTPHRRLVIVELKHNLWSGEPSGTQPCEGVPCVLWGGYVQKVVPEKVLWILAPHVGGFFKRDRVMVTRVPNTVAADQDKNPGYWFPTHSGREVIFGKLIDDIAPGASGRMTINSLTDDGTTYVTVFNIDTFTAAKTKYAKAQYTGIAQKPWILTTWAC